MQGRNVGHFDRGDLRYRVACLGGTSTWKQHQMALNLHGNALKQVPPLGPKPTIARGGGQFVNLGIELERDVSPAKYLWESRLE